MSTDQTYTVSELSRLAGVSVRTLRYYDQIGLLNPARREDNGFREYQREHVIKLQQILLYRELDFSIDAIREILVSGSYDLLKTFDGQKSMLMERINKAQLMIESIDKSIANIKEKIDHENIFDSIPKDKIDRWNKIRESQGQPTIPETVAQHSACLTPADESYLNDESKHWCIEYSKLLHLPIESKKVQDQVLQHYRITNHSLYCTNKGFEGIGYNGYKAFASQILDDDVTYELHEHNGQGLAEHLNKAMLYFAENTLKDSLDELRKLGADGELKK